MLEGTTEWCVCAFLHVESNHGGIAIATNSNLVLEIRLLGSSCPDKTARQRRGWSFHQSRHKGLYQMILSGPTQHRTFIIA